MESQFSEQVINTRFDELVFQQQFSAYIDYLCWRGFTLGLQPVSFETFKRRVGYHADEIIALYEGTGMLFYTFGSPHILPPTITL